MSAYFPELNYFEIPTFSERLFKQIKHRNVLVVMEKDYSEHEELFGKIIKAAGIVPNENATLVVLKDDEAFNLASTADQEEVRLVLMFGVEADRVGFNFKVGINRLLQTERFSIINTNSLYQLNSDVKLKGQLWAALKEGIENR